MIEIDDYLMEQNRGDIQKETEAIYLPYKCGKIEAELIAIRFNNYVKADTYNILQPKAVHIL